MSCMEPLPTLSEIEAAKALIRPHIHETPAYRWPLLEAGLGCELWLKHENHTPVGAFKTPSRRTRLYGRVETSANPTCAA
jgi:threonine dehydratase